MRMSVVRAPAGRVKTPRLRDLSSKAAVLAATLFPLLVCNARAQTGRLEGTVRNVLTGEPVAHARVSIVGTSMFAMTDRDGHYRIFAVPVGSYDVHVEFTGYVVTTGQDRRVTVVDPATLAGPPPMVDFELRPIPEPAVYQPAPLAIGEAVAPGFGGGFSVGVDQIDGTANRAIAAAASLDLYFRYGFPLGLFIYAGGHFSAHHLTGVSKPYRMQSLFIEPRFVAMHLASRWAPYVSVRVAVARETVQTVRIRFQGSARAVGAGGGVLFRLTPTVALDAGVSGARVWFGDFVMKPDLATYLCVENLAAGSTLPESAIQCGEIETSLPQYTCYPPFYSRVSGSCDAPKVPVADSRRSGTWLRFSLGLHLRLSGR
jgi:hypothetical protein